MLRTMIVPTPAAALAAASSPCGWARRLRATGASMTGKGMVWPRTCVEASTSLMPARTRGLSWMRWKDSRLALRVTSSSAPPAMKSQEGLGTLSRASGSNSWTFTGSIALRPCCDPSVRGHRSRRAVAWRRRRARRRRPRLRFG